MQDKINIIIGRKGYGKTYHEMKILIREKDKEIEKLNNIINKAIGLIYDYQMNDEENENYKELLYILKGSDKE